METPRQLHQSEGLTIVENPKNQFVVVSLMFTADPAKRSPEWRREAEAGITKAKFAKEYLLDYTALMGEKVFPMFGAYKEKIIINEPYPEFGRDIPCFGGFDYGTRNPSSFHVYIEYDGCWHSVWELYEPCQNLPAFAAKMKACPYWDAIKYIAADRNIWTPYVPRDTQLVSVQQLFWEQGITKFIKGGVDEQAFIGKINQHWRDLDNREPTFKILACCPNQIREFSEITYTNSVEEYQTKNYKEEMRNYRNHAIDDCKYFMLSQGIGKPSNAKIRQDMWKRWKT